MSDLALDRRAFLEGSAYTAAGLVLFGSHPTNAARQGGAASSGLTASESAITAWIRITPDNRVTIISSQAELGQGISTTLPAIVADELGADWTTVDIATAPFALAYRNPRANWMFTGNSESIQSFADLMRQMGAAAREMLVSAAAQRWAVPTDRCHTEASRIIHASSNRSIAFGTVAAEAARLRVPQKPVLKAKSALKLVGRALPKIDVPGKVDGSAVFGIDFKVPDMLIAAIHTAPAIGGSLKSIDEPALKARPGVRGIVRLQTGIAVVADTYYQARSALLVHPPAFETGPNPALTSASVDAAQRLALDAGPWSRAVDEGDAAGAIARSKGVISFDYESPWAAHATMEPMNATAHVTADRCEIWAPTQGQEFAHVVLKSVLGLKDEQVFVNRTPAIGGGFGRRLLPDFVLQAALVSKAIGRPVKAIWDREEDMLHDHYRPGTATRMTAALGDDGVPEAVHAKHVSPTILLAVFPPIAKVLEEKKIDPSALEGMLESRYAFPSRRVDFHLFKTPIPTSVMRGTGYGPSIFAIESFIDELAAAAKIDPYRYRRRLLVKDARALRVLDRAAALGGWGKPLAKSRGRGIAFADAFGTLIAQVIEVEITGNDLRLVRIATAVDCGDVLDPDIAAAGIEGGIVFGLAYCKAEVTFKDGRPQQQNLDAYELPYLAETPPMITEFIKSGEKIGGIGEVSPVTVPPALANAIHAATGSRLRSMPIGRHGLRFA
jgi:isoquinoline 1-oxidoreductase subunit beta